MAHWFRKSYWIKFSIKSKYELINRFLEIGEAPDGIFVKVQWVGLSDNCDWTWNSVVQLHEDVPDK